MKNAMKKSLLTVAIVMTVSMNAFAEKQQMLAVQNALTAKTKCLVNDAIQRNAIPKTPHNMSLPEFGQGVIGWATGEQGAKTRLENIQKSDLNAIQEKGTTLAMVKEWQAFYENEVKRNPCNPTAPYRAELMKKIAWLWGE